MSFNGLLRIVIRIFMILFFLMMSAIGWILWGEGLFINYLISNGNSDLVETKGTVVGEQTIGIIHLVDVEYFVNDQKYTAYSNVLLGNNQIDKHQSILYDSQQVSNAIMKSTSLGYIFIFAGIIIILISYVITIWIPKKLLKRFLPKKENESFIRIDLANASQTVSRTLNNIGIDTSDYKTTNKSYDNTYDNTYENDDTENPIK